MQAVEVITFPVAPLGCNCSILRCKETNQAIVLDPGGEAERIIAELEKRKARVVHILHTHAHFDHVLGTHDLACHCQQKQASGPGDAQQTATKDAVPFDASSPAEHNDSGKDESSSNPSANQKPVSIGLHRGDESLYNMVETQCRWFGLPPQKAESPINHWIEDNEIFEFGQARLEVLHTPGHTPGSCSFQLNGAGVVFTGDTLFAGGIGRTDLPGGDGQQIIKSIKDRLLNLDDGTQVIPGHGGFTRIYEEKQHNPFL